MAAPSVRQLVPGLVDDTALAAILRVDPEQVAAWARGGAEVPQALVPLLSSWGYLTSCGLRVDFELMADQIPSLEPSRAQGVLENWIVIADRLKSADDVASRPLSWLVWRRPQVIHVRSYRGDTFSFILLPGGVPAVARVLEAADHAQVGALATDALRAALQP